MNQILNFLDYLLPLLEGRPPLLRDTVEGREPLPLRPERLARDPLPSSSSSMYWLLPLALETRPDEEGREPEP